MAQIAIDPTSGAEIDRYDETGADELETILDSAVETQRRWADLSVEDRAGPMREAADALRRRKAEWAELMTREMGKPIEAAEAEVEKCAWVCEYYAENTGEFLAPVAVDTDAHRSYWTHRPLGVVLAVMPWNFPFWQVFRFAAPNLMAGNAGLLSHSENVPGCSLAIEEILHEAGFPPALFRSLLIDNDTTGDLLDDDRVRAATVTGSVGAGRAIAERAGRNLKTTVLELGGSDPYLVLADADVPRAAASCATSRLVNSGQSCIAAKRMIVDAAVYDDFMEHFVARMEEAVLGDPMESATDMGPMAREDLRDGLHDQVVRSVDAGATLALGGELPERDGWWYPATVLTDVEPGMAAYAEELFGPVATVLRARDEEDAIRIANDTEFGLGAAVFTRDVRRGERIAAERIQAGCCFVNAFVRSDPRLPFGGVKNSGYGRELSPLGIREFVNQKTVWVDE